MKRKIYTKSTCKTHKEKGHLNKKKKREHAQIKKRKEKTKKSTTRYKDRKTKPERICLQTIGKITQRFVCFVFYFIYHPYCYLKTMK